MSVWKSLPLEVWSIVFNNHIHTAAQLAECRLVCRKWSYIAETAMFGKNLVVSRSSMPKLIARLEKDTKRAMLIKQLSFPEIEDGDWDDDEYNKICIQLLEVACTPTLEHIKSGYGSAPFLQHVLHTIRNRSTIFKNVKKIVVDQVEENDTYCKILYSLKDSLQEVYLDLNTDFAYSTEILLKLDEFEQLKSIRLNYFIDYGIEVWDKMIQSCNKLENLYIDNRDEESWIREDVVTTTEEIVWRKSDVQQFKNMKKLHYIGNYCPEFLEYLIYKFPNVNYMQIWVIKSPDLDIDKDLARLVAVVKNLKAYTLTFTIMLISFADFKTVFGLSKRAKRNLNIVLTDDREIYIHVKLEQDCVNYTLLIPSVTYTLEMEEMARDVVGLSRY